MEMYTTVSNNTTDKVIGVCLFDCTDEIMTNVCYIAVLLLF